MRRYAREVAFCKVYEYLMSKTVDIDLSMFEVDKLTEEDVSYINGLYNYTCDNITELLAKIETLVIGYKIERVYKIDLSVLLLAIAELKSTDTPKEIIINEAVDIAKKFSTDKSVTFVNGVLAEYVRGVVANV
ncbi:MAG: transcription antitermination factor NusB [Clostridia bacterium]